jgi:hypothetical protein
MDSHGIHPLVLNHATFTMLCKQFRDDEPTLVSEENGDRGNRISYPDWISTRCQNEPCDEMKVFEFNS